VSGEGGVDIEQMFATVSSYSSTEQAFDTHMFAVRTFGVKCLSKVSDLTHHRAAVSTAIELDRQSKLSHPPRTILNMALAFQPLTFEPEFPPVAGSHAPAGRVQIPAPVHEHPSVARARAAVMYRRRRIGFIVAAGIFLYGLWTLALGVVSIAGAAPTADVGSLATSLPAVVSVHVPDAAAASLYVVQPGDTLWSIAEDLDLGGDLRGVVDRVAELNGGRTTLRPGQRLVLPAR